MNSMSDGFVHWYHRGWDANQAASVLGSLDRRGLMLGNPSTGLISTVTNGPVSWGEQVFVARVELMGAAGLSGVDEVNFQFWLDGDTDVFMRMRRCSGSDVIALEFGLDGMSQSQQSHVVRAVSSEIGARREACMGFVVDQRGVSEDEDWDGVILGGLPRRGPWPDRFALRSEEMARHPELSGLIGRQEPPLVVFHRPSDPASDRAWA
ncbi:hypothetical protein ACFVZR_30355 [Streptomyces sp. NPDC058316]|uniref:hypothetical protein n=1 Tax=unclassified Streptomyces TaxID=2593676 RepID=UPI0034348D49